MSIDPLPLDWHAARIAERRRAFLSPVLDTFVAYESLPVWRRGEGAYLWDASGRRHLDAMAQNVCISVGYRHPGVDAAVRSQLDEIQHVTTAYAHPQPGHLAEELVARLPAGHDWVVHFVNSGAEAIDLAVLAARVHTGHFEVLTLRDAYHGMHFTAMAATGIGHAHQPVPPAPGFVSVIAPHSYHGPFGGDAAPYLDELSRTIAAATSGDVAAMIVEPIQGYGGIVEMPQGYLAGAAQRAREAGGLFIVDEVQTGFGRTGSHFWGFEAHGVVPDAIVMSKGIGNGFPIAAMVTRREIAESMTRRMFFNTYGANPVSCAAARAVLRAIDDEALRANADRCGKAFERAFAALGERHASIGDVRGRGLLRGVELVGDRRARTPDAAAAARAQSLLREEGVIVGLCGAGHNVLKINPPLCVTEDDIANLAAACDAALCRL
ncbi:MAG TPA: aspartate aminotransferase family protein [Caldimonas sp.]|nr:aspartate aminotransferase family protein [Caldimonas sp.]